MPPTPPIPASAERLGPWCPEEIGPERHLGGALRVILLVNLSHFRGAPEERNPSTSITKSQEPSCPLHWVMCTFRDYYGVLLE